MQIKTAELKKKSKGDVFWLIGMVSFVTKALHGTAL